MSEVLIDTNIFVYMHDPRDQGKKTQSTAIVDRLVNVGVAVVSVQCLNEFYRAVRWRIPEPLTANEALETAKGYASNCRVLPITATAALNAMRACAVYSMSFWDSLIWAVANENGIPYLLTEDLDDGVIIEGVRVRNPFTSTFDIASLT